MSYVILLLKTVILVVCIIAGWTNISIAATYVSKMLPHVGSCLYNPRINNRGEVVSQCECNIYNQNIINLYSCGVAKELYKLGCHNVKPHINNKGEVVWLNDYGDSYEIEYYFNGTTNIINTNVGYDSYPQIDDQSRIWWSYNGSVYCYDNNNTSNVCTLPFGAGPIKMNANGDFAFIAFYVYIYSKGGLKIVDNGPTDGSLPDISLNDNGDVVWNDMKNIYLNSNGKTSVIAKNNNHFSGYYTNLRINNKRQVVWDAMNGTISLYDNGTVSIITKPASSPDINDFGKIAFAKGSVYLAAPILSVPLNILLSKLMPVPLNNPELDFLNKSGIQPYEIYQLTAIQGGG